MAANFVDQVKGLREDVRTQVRASPARAAALAAIDATVTALQTLATAERTELETLAGEPLAGMAEAERAAWLEVLRAKRLAGR